MREILFRGQTRRKGQKVWMDGTPVDSNWVEGYGVCMGKGDFSVIYSGNHIEKFPVYTDTVGQFTGMTDKNGKRIYEGDIVRFDDGTFVVQFYECRMGFAFSGLSGRGCVPGFGMTKWEHIEVIGNIHDDPELLGGTDNA